MGITYERAPSCARRQFLQSACASVIGGALASHALAGDEDTNPSFKVSPHATSFAYILKKRSIDEPRYIRYVDNFVRDKPIMRVRKTYYTVSFDLNADDEFADPMRFIIQNTKKDLQEHLSSKDLLACSTWTLEQRRQWEKHLCETINGYLRLYKALHTYRLTTPVDEDLPVAKYQIYNLNDFSNDIKNDDYNCRNCCFEMTLVKGILMQTIEQDCLPALSIYERDNYKRKGEYYYVSADTMRPTEKKSTMHSFIISNITSDYNEPTLYTDSIMPVKYARLKGAKAQTTAFKSVNALFDRPFVGVLPNGFTFSNSFDLQNHHIAREHCLDQNTHEDTSPTISP